MAMQRRARCQALVLPEPTELMAASAFVHGAMCRQGHTKSSRRDALCYKSDIKKKTPHVLKSAPVVGRAVGSAMMFASTSDTAWAKAAKRNRPPPPAVSDSESTLQYYPYLIRRKRREICNKSRASAPPGRDL